MDKQKEIQDIAWNICEMLGKPDSCDKCTRLCNCPSLVKSEKIYNKGFRRHQKNQIGLPCMPGDSIFVISCLQIYKERITGILITQEGVEIITRKNKYPSEYIGEKIYLNFSDAKDQLKEECSYG